MYYVPQNVLVQVCSDAADKYCFGFNEKDNEWAGIGNAQDYGFRLYDTRVARFRSVDPLTRSFPYYTPYQFASNTPVRAIDLDGLEAVIMDRAGKSINVFANIYMVTKGEYTVNTTMIRSVVENEIVNKIKNNQSLSQYAGYKYNINIDVINAGTYKQAVEAAKTSTITYENGNGSSYSYSDYRTGVVVQDLGDDHHNPVYNRMVDGGAFAEYEAVDDNQDGNTDFKRINIRSPLSYEVPNSTYREKEYYKRKKFTHELGHFIFTITHPSDNKSRGPKGITAEEDRLIELQPEDIQEQMSPLYKPDKIKDVVN